MIIEVSMVKRYIYKKIINIKYKKSLKYKERKSIKESQKDIHDFYYQHTPRFKQDIEINPEYDLMIIVPVYNAAEYLEDCIKSLLVQETGYSYCVVFVNDGSTDESANILNKYAKKENVYIINKKNEGVAEATFVVASRGDANAYSNLSSANTMAKTFEKILKSNIMEKKICEKLKVEELDADIHAKVLEGTNMLVLSVTADTPKDSIDIIRTVMDNYSSVSLYTVGSAVMDVLEEPKVPYTPDNPLDAGGQAKKGGLVAGALVLILLGLFSYMKNTIKQENEIEKKLDARSLGAISYEWKYKTIRDIFRRKKKAILVDDPVASFRFVESYKKLAAKVEYRMAKNEQKVLVVTSVSENEGKSTVAANLAITLAEQSKRVLLVDGDIRRPSQFLIFGMEPKEENELGEYLKGNRALADVMVPCTRKHMLFMGGKNCYSSSTEMLNSDSFYKLMTACRKFVDYVIIDTPPAGIIGDAQIFAHCADAVMIVSKQNYMLAEDINEVMDAFRDKEGKVLGVVLNGVRSFSGLVDSPVGHYYGKYSKYGRYGNYGRSKGM